jgi:hypothetical protein
MRRSYQAHYRRLLPPLLETLEFRSNNEAHRPVVLMPKIVAVEDGFRRRRW